MPAETIIVLQTIMPMISLIIMRLLLRNAVEVCCGPPEKSYLWKILVIICFMEFSELAYIRESQLKQNSIADTVRLCQRCRMCKFTWLWWSKLSIVVNQCVAELLNFVNCSLIYKLSYALSHVIFRYMAAIFDFSLSLASQVSKVSK